MLILLGDEAFRWSKLPTSWNSVRPIPKYPSEHICWFLRSSAFETPAAAQLEILGRLEGQSNDCVGRVRGAAEGWNYRCTEGPAV